MNKSVAFLFTVIMFVLGAITLAFSLHIGTPAHVRAEIGNTVIPTPTINAICKTCNNTAIELTTDPCETCDIQDYVIDAKSYNGTDPSLPTPMYHDSTEVSIYQSCNCSPLVLDAKDNDGTDPSMPVPSNEVHYSLPALLESTSGSMSCVYSICGWAATEYSNFLNWRFSDPTCTGECYWIGGCGYRYASYCPSRCVSGSEGRGCCYSICGKDTSEYSSDTNWRFSDPTCTGSCYWINNCGYRYATYCPTGCNNGCGNSICGKDTSEYSSDINWRFSDPSCTGECYWINNCGYRNAEYCDNGCSNGSCQSDVCSTGWKCNAEGRGSNWMGYQNSDCSWTSIANCDASDGYKSSNYCYDTDLYRDYNDYYCSGGSCLYSTTKIKQSECGTAGCSNGQCNTCPAPSTPTILSPAQGSTGASINSDLSWAGNADSYDVYFEAGDSTPDVLVSSSQTGTTFDPGILSYNTHYYLQICAKKNCGTSVLGNVWDFTTEIDVTPWYFAVITDTHIGEGTAHNDFHEDTYDDWEEGDLIPVGGQPSEYLQKVVKYINDSNIDIKFVVIDGDLTQSAEFSESAKCRDILHTLDVPWLPVIGNHDIWPYSGGLGVLCDNEALGIGLNGERPDSYFNDFFVQQYQEFPNQLGVEPGDWEKQLIPLVKPNTEEIYNFQNLAFDYNGVHFVCLDFNNRHQAFGPACGVNAEGDLYNWTGGTWDWFKEDVTNYVDSNPQSHENIVIFSHHYMLTSFAGYTTFTGSEIDTMKEFLDDYKDNVYLNFGGHSHPGCIQLRELYDGDTILLGVVIIPANYKQTIALIVKVVPNAVNPLAPDIILHSALPAKAWVIDVKCPVDLIVTDPDGQVVSETVNDISSNGIEAIYQGADNDGDGIDDGHSIWFPDRKEGQYNITVLKEPGADPSETYTLTVSPMEGIFGYTPIVLTTALVGTIPEEGKVYQFEFTERTPTNITYSGSMGGDYGATVTLKAVLTDNSSNPLSGKTVNFIIGNQSTSAVTYANGSAIASVVLDQFPYDGYNVEAGFVGDIDYLPAYDEGPFGINGTVAFIEAPDIVKESGEFTAQIAIDNVVDFKSGTYTITFNSAVIGVTSITGGMIGGTTVNVDDWYDAGSGKVTIENSVNSGVSGSGNLSEIHFKVVGSADDMSSIEFTGDCSLSDSSQYAITNYWGSDAPVYIYIEPCRCEFVETFDTWSSTNASTWVIKDLSEYGVPPNAVCEVAIQNTRMSSVSTHYSGGVRAVGSTFARSVEISGVRTDGGRNVLTMYVQTDSDARIEYYAEDPDYICFTLTGYWPCAVYNENMVKFNVTTTNSWEDKDLSTYGVLPGEVVEIVMANRYIGSSVARVAGVRENGSELNRTVTLPAVVRSVNSTATMQVRADENSCIEAYAGDKNAVDFYVVGNWISIPCIWTEEFEDFSPPSANATWVDADLSAYEVPANAVAEVVLVNKDTVHHKIGVRKGGSTIDRCLDLSRSAGVGGIGRVHVVVGENSSIQLYHDNIVKPHSFYMTGYWGQMPSASTPTPTNTVSPTVSSTVSPTISPTLSPTVSPTLSPTVSPTPTKPPIIYGDVNDDGDITTIDRIWLTQMLGGSRPTHPSGDANMDGRVTTVDRSWLNQILMGYKSVVYMHMGEYDFSSGAGVDKYARWSNIVAPPPELNTTFDTDPAGWVNATSGQHTNISLEDGVVWTIDGVTGNYTALQCKFTVSEGAYTGNITSIGVTFNGTSEVSGDPLQLWAWNFDTESWTQIGSDTALGNASSQGYTQWTAWGKVFADYIDASNYIYVLYTHNTPGKNLNTDYVKLEIVYPD